MTDVPTLRALQPEADPEIVEELEVWLRLAKSGQLRWVTLVGGVFYDGQPDLYTRMGSAGEVSDLTRAAVLEQEAFFIRGEILKRRREVEDGE